VATTPMKVPDLRQPRDRIDPKGDSFRIVVVGDSFSWGDGVHSQEAFPFRLERQLNLQFGDDRFEVVNWSHPGWGTIHEFRSIVPQLDELQPDLLVLSFILNDPEPVKHRRRARRWSALEPQIPESGLTGLLYRHSRLFEFVWGRLENSRVYRELDAYYHDLFQGETWENCKWALREIQEATSERNIPMALVVFPLFQGQLDDSYPYSDLHTAARGACESLGMPVLDLFDSYSGVDGRRLAVTPFTDAHPSELAHRIAGDAILEFLLATSLVPQSGNSPPVSGK